MPPTAASINGFPVTQGFDYRTNMGLTGGCTSVLSPRAAARRAHERAQFGENRDPAADVRSGARSGSRRTAVQLMGGYKYLPLMTIGTFSTTNENSTIASLGTQPFGLGRRLQPADGHVLGRADADQDLGRAHVARRLRLPRISAGRSRATGSPAAVSSSTAPTRAPTTRAALNDRAQSWAQFMLGLPTAATGAVATPGTQSSQFEIASPGEFNQMYHGLFVQDDWRVNPTADPESRPAVRDQRRHDGVRGPQPRRLRPRSREPDRGRGAGGVRARARSREIPVAEFKVKGGLLFADGPVNETVTKVLPRARPSVSAHRATVLRGGVGLFSYDYFFENINQAGFSQATPVIVDERQRPDVHRREADQSDSERPADAAGRRRARAGEPARSEPRHAVPAGSRGAVLHAAGRSACSTTAAAAGWRRSPTSARAASNLPVVAAGQQHPDAVPIDVAHAATRPSRRCCRTNVTESVRRPAAGQHDQRRHRARNQLLRPYPQFGTFAIEDYEGSDRYDAATMQLEKRFRSGNSLTVQYTRSSTARQAELPEPAERRARGSGLAERSAEPLVDRHQPAAAVRPQRALGQGLEPALDAVSAAGR